MTRILVTGASGFVGRALVAEPADAGHYVRAAMQAARGYFPSRSSICPSPGFVMLAQTLGVWTPAPEEPKLASAGFRSLPSPMISDMI